MRKSRKQSRVKKYPRGQVIRILGGLIGGGLLLSNIDHVNGVEGIGHILDLSSLLIENVLDKTITVIELLIKLGKSE